VGENPSPHQKTPPKHPAPKKAGEK